LDRRDEQIALAGKINHKPIFRITVDSRWRIGLFNTAAIQYRDPSGKGFVQQSQFWSIASLSCRIQKVRAA
jgi:hypothetical protein